MSVFSSILKFIYCSDFKTSYVLVVGKILESKPALISIYLKISLEAEKLQKRTIYIDFLLKKLKFNYRALSYFLLHTIKPI